MAALQRRRLQTGRRLHQRHCRAHRRILTALTDCNLSRVRQIPSGLVGFLQQRQRYLRRFLIRHRHDRVLDRQAARIDLAELRRANPDVVILQTHALDAQTAREVIQRARINQLAADRRRRLRRIPQQVRVTQTVEPHPRHEFIVRKHIFTLIRRVCFVVIPIDRQNLPGSLFNRHDIRQRDAILVLIPHEVQIRVYLVDPVLFRALSTRLHALNAVDFRLNRRLRAIVRLRIAQIDVPIHARQLRQPEIPARHRRYVAEPRRRRQIRRAIRHHEVIRQHETAHRTPQKPILIRLLKRRTHQRQPEQHLVEFFVEFRRQFRQVQVHELLNARRLRLQLLVRDPNHLCFHGPRGRQQFASGHCLPTNHRFRHQRVIDATRALKRHRAVLNLQTHQLDALRHRRFPVPARLTILLHTTQQRLAERVQVHIIHVQRQIRVERRVFQSLYLRLEINLDPAVVQFRELGAVQHRRAVIVDLNIGTVQRQIHIDAADAFVHRPERIFQRGRSACHNYPYQ